ncbi:hypothetical protein WJX79_010604 [Trebouxia sp. C0005]
MLGKEQEPAASQQNDKNNSQKAKGNTGVITTGLYGTLSQTPINWEKTKWFCPQEGQTGRSSSKASTVETQ